MGSFDFTNCPSYWQFGFKFSKRNNLKLKTYFMPNLLTKFVL